MATVLESDKYKLGGSDDRVSTDKGLYPGLYEVGTSLTLIPVDSSDSSLVGYWKFDEGSGTSAYDASGKGNNGTWNGTGTHYTTGKVGSYAGQFNGSDAYVNLGGTPSLKPIIVTLSFWAKINSYNTDPTYKPLVGFYYTSGMKSYGIDEDSFRIAVIDSSQKAITFTHKSLGEWHYYTITYDKQNLIGYIDGVQTGAPVASTLSLGYGGYLYAGKLYDTYPTGPPLNGLVDDIRVYNRALSAAEVLALYNATK